MAAAAVRRGRDLDRRRGHRRAARRARAALLHDLGEDRERDLGGRARADRRSPAGVCRRSRSSSATSSARDGTAAPRSLARHEPDIRHALGERRGERRLLVAAVRGDDEREVVAASPAPSPRPTSKPDVRRELAQRLGDRRVADDHDARRRAARVEEDLQRAAAVARVVRGDRAVDDRPRRRRRRAPAAAAAARPSPSRAARAGAPSSSAQTPPTNPSMVPSASTSAASPGRALVGLCARTTVAVTNAWRARPATAGARSARAVVITAAASPFPASRPTRAPACTACRCGRRRATRAARRSPR